MKAVEAGEYLFLLFTYSGYFLFFLAFTGLWDDASLYLEDVTNYYKMVIGLVLLYIFNPYITTKIKPIHERMAFNAGLYLLLSGNLLLIFNNFVETTKKTTKGILIKFPKKKQDLRIDLPTIGLDTLRDCKKVGIKGIVLKSKQNVFMDKSKIISFANKNKIFIKVL